MTKYILLLLSAIILPFGIWAQAIYSEPPVESLNPEDTVTIFIDVSQTDRTQLLDDPGPLYLWTWMPNDPTSVGGNGEWGNSNDALEMTKVSDNLWSFKMVPTEFYEVEAKDVYENGFAMLAKRKDGSDDGNGEGKTEDLILEVPVPVSGPQKVFTFPEFDDSGETDTLRITNQDVFSFFYDNNLEENDKLKAANAYYLFARATGSDNLLYRIAVPAEVVNTEQLRMTDVGEGVYRMTMIPAQFFAEVLPAGLEVIGVRFRIVGKTDTGFVPGNREYVFEIPGCE